MTRREDAEKELEAVREARPRAISLASTMRPGEVYDWGKVHPAAMARLLEVLLAPGPREREEVVQARNDVLQQARVRSLTQVGVELIELLRACSFHPTESHLVHAHHLVREGERLIAEREEE